MYFKGLTILIFIIPQIREKLVSKQATEDKLDKVRKLRDLKKFGKKVQQEVAAKRQKEKREMLDQVCGQIIFPCANDFI